MNEHSQTRLAQLAPQVKTKAQQMIAALSFQGIDCEVTQGMRSMDEQSAYYAQGRLSLDEVNTKRAAASLLPITDAENTVVTNAAPGESYHEYGLALDVAPFDAAGNPDWDVTHPAWAKIIAAGEAVGFTSGSCWHQKDNPHFQYTGKFPVTPDIQVWGLWQQGGIPAVWQAAFVPQPQTPTTGAQEA